MKKVFSVLAVILFMSISPLKAKEASLPQRDCVEETFWAMDVAEAYGHDQATTICLGNAYYAACSGYSINFQDCLN